MPYNVELVAYIDRPILSAGQENLYTLLGLAGTALVGVVVPALGAIGLSIAFIQWFARLCVNTWVTILS